jgi:predicted transglutaminase-like cysteine proteinase
MLKSELNQPEREQLDAVNRFFNQQLNFQDDTRIWRQTDYWATPEESLIKGAADCEDYALAKYFSLRQLGIPSEKLRITYVKALSQNQAHMVLTFYSSPTAEPLVLDNLIGEIRPASQRKDLLPVYAFNAEGLYLPGANGGKRSSDSKKLSRWQDVLKKMQAEGFAVGEG